LQPAKVSSCIAVVVHSQHHACYKLYRKIRV